MENVVTVPQALLSLRPGAAYNVRGDDYAGIEWLDEAQSMPSEAEVSAEIERLSSLNSVPQVVSDRQFFQQLAVQGTITQDEAIAAVATGTLPASMVQLVSQLPPDQQFGANMLLKGAIEFKRSHPMVPVLGAAYGWTSAQLDALWTAAAVL